MSDNESTDKELKLQVPDLLPVISKQQAQKMVSDAQGTKHDPSNSALVDQLSELDPTSPQLLTLVDQATNLGKDDAEATTRISGEILRRKEVMKSEAGKKVSATLTDLRNEITDLDPNRASYGGIKKPLMALSRLATGNKIEHYLTRFESSQDKLDAIMAALESGKFDLSEDNETLSQEQLRLWESMGRLNEAGITLEDIDKKLENTISDLKSSGNKEKAEELTANALFPIRQRRQDVATELAVATQGYMSIGLLIENNKQLIKGVERAKTTTFAALYTSVIIKSALTRQGMVLDQLDSLKSATSNMIESASKQMREQGADINAKSSETMVDIQKLQVAFNNVYATLDAVDSYKSKATENMKANVAALSTQLDQAGNKLIERKSDYKEIES